jgi:sugar lactone lactonase YvrE
MELTKRNRGFYRALTALVAGGVICLAGSAPAEISIPDARAFPESLSSTADGTLFIGSQGRGMVFRVPPGASAASPWIKPGTNGLQNVLGVLADERSGTLWLCSNDLSRDDGKSALKSFDLKTGIPKGSFDFPSGKSLCNDIVIAPDGTAYVSDTFTPRILKLKKGGSALEVWIQSEKFSYLDGLAFGSKNALYINEYTSGRLLRVDMGPDGAAGSITEIQTSRKLEHPDGMRAVGPDQFLLIEGAGRLDRVNIEGDRAKIEVLKDAFIEPTAVTPVGGLAWVVEGKLSYLEYPKKKDQDPGPFKAYPVQWRSAR